MTLSMAAAGQALAESVTPSGSGIPVAGAGTAAGALSVDGAVNQLVEAIKVGDSCWRASAPALHQCLQRRQEDWGHVQRKRPISRSDQEIQPGSSTLRRAGAVALACRAAVPSKCQTGCNDCMHHAWAPVLMSSSHGIQAAGGYVQQGLDVAGVGAKYAKEVRRAALHWRHHSIAALCYTSSSRRLLLGLQPHDHCMTHDLACMASSCHVRSSRRRTRRARTCAAPRTRCLHM